MSQILGNEGYSSELSRFIELSELVPFEELHQSAQHLFPSSPAFILDVGAGIGRDAAAFAKIGHQVIAAEPTAEFIQVGQQKYPLSNIQWVQDAFPQLRCLDEYSHQFDFILCHLVWQHLDTEARLKSMRRVSELLKSDGLFDLTLRHGSKGLGDYHFEVCAEQAIEFAGCHGLVVALRLDHLPGAIASSQGVAWICLTLKKEY